MFKSLLLTRFGPDDPCNYDGWRFFVDNPIVSIPLLAVEHIH